MPRWEISFAELQCEEENTSLSLREPSGPVIHLHHFTDLYCLENDHHLAKGFTIPCRCQIMDAAWTKELTKCCRSFSERATNAKLVAYSRSEVFSHQWNLDSLSS
ncbi:hypothetical protein Y1Q_0010195 [Alligator mississippiensis]|uniref:Uncharacterized protein n=1 Tax=Alligator mississippiensis TaxID=8496 RepID=A0A151NG94_ALLMI|nr:hypothetical protein Y1Q_0010195 [Alligator mississippiensis]